MGLSTEELRTGKITSTWMKSNTTSYNYGGIIPYGKLPLRTLSTKEFAMLVQPLSPSESSFTVALTTLVGGSDVNVIEPFSANEKLSIFEANLAASSCMDKHSSGAEL